MIVAGILAAMLGVAATFGRERWILDRNLLIVRSRLFGWKSEQPYVDGTLKLTRVCREINGEDGKVTRWFWELHLQNLAGPRLKVLWTGEDDDVPRRTGRAELGGGEDDGDGVVPAR